MGRRPICLVCMLLMLALCLADLAGIPIIRGNPLPESLQAWIAGHPEAVICGEVQQCAETENSHSIYLKRVRLLFSSDEAGASAKDASDTEVFGASVRKVSIENVRVFLKKEKYIHNKQMEKIPAGTMVKVSGRLVRVPETRNPGEFDSRQYYACSHIFYFLQDGVILQKSSSYSGYLQGLLDIRERFAEIFKEAAGSDAPVFEAMVLGEKSGLEAETRLRYQMAGIIHILAISGMHISLLGEGLYRILKRVGLGIFLSGMLSLVLMHQYGMLTGGSVAAMRAVCMFVMAVGAQLLGRCYDRMTALALSALLLILSAPANLYSSGFLLSFGAVLGLAAGAVIEEFLGGKKLMKPLRALISSTAVQLMTLPVMLYFYGEVSLAGIFLNLAVMPTVGAVLASGICGGLLGVFHMEAARIVLLPGRALLFLYDRACVLAGRLSWCTWIGGQPKLWQTGIYYGCLFLALLLMRRAAEGRRMHMAEENAGSKKTAVARKSVMKRSGIAGVLLVCIGIFAVAYRRTEGLTITCLDVGQGDGIVLETSEGSHFLIDGGSSNKSGVAQYQLLPFLKSRGISRLDGILVSHTDNDHISGISELLTMMGEGLTGVRADMMVLPEWTEKNEAYEELEALAERAGVTVRQGSCGDVLEDGKLRLLFLSPESGSTGADVNEEGAVMELQYGNFRGLFTGDIGEKTEKTLLPLLSDVDFLKVAHHGSRYSTSEDFLAKVLPEVGVISCSSTNTYGHPSEETIERLEEHGCRVEYTMNSGAVSCWTDGKRYTIKRWIQTEK